MHDNKFLTLPVCEDDGTVIGLVDVMDLIHGCGGGAGWRSIFGSAMDVSDDGSDRQSLSSFNEIGLVRTTKVVDPVIRVAPPPKLNPVVVTDMNVPLHVSIPDDQSSRKDSFNGSYIEEMQSISRHKSRSGFNDGLSSVAMSLNTDNQCLFKVVDSVGNNYRFRCECNYEILLGSLATKMGVDTSLETIELKFTDEDGDTILIRDDECLLEAVSSSKTSGGKAIKLVVSTSQMKSSSVDNKTIMFAGAGAALLLGIIAITVMKPKK